MRALELLKQHRNKVLNLALVVIAVGALFVFLTKAHWWKKLSGARVIYNGQSLADAGVYRSPNGELLVDLREVPDEAGLFIVYPTLNDVGHPNERHFLILPGYAYSRYVHPIVVFMKTKGEFDHKLVVEPNLIEFSTRDGRGVQVILE